MGAASGQLAGEDFHDGGGEHVESEKAEIIAGAQAGDDEFLFGLGGGGFFEYRFDFEELVTSGDAVTADGAVVWQFAFVGGLHGGDRAFFLSDRDEELGGAGCFGAAQVEVISDHEEEGILVGEGGGAMDCVAVAEGFGLWDEVHAAGVRSGSSGVGGFVAGGDDYGDFLDSSVGDFLGEDGECGFRGAVAVDEGLEREGALIFSGGGDDGFGDFHGLAGDEPGCGVRGDSRADLRAAAALRALAGGSGTKLKSSSKCWVSGVFE